MLAGMEEALHSQAKHFWDHHHHVLEDPNFWMAVPLCRLAINQRISGNPHRWPLEWFGERFVPRPRPRALSLGCGTGNLERAARRINLCDQIVGIDFSEASLDVARAKAREEGLTGISYQIGDLDNLEIPRGVYDLVFIHQSLHHVLSLEKLLSRVAKAMKPNGLLFLEEWTGPSRSEWKDDDVEDVNKLFQQLPYAWRLWPGLITPIAKDDPSEGVRSSMILPRIRLLFDVIAERPYGGHIVSVLLPQVNREKIPAAEFDRLIGYWLDLEDSDVRRDPRRSYHTVVVARPRGPIGGRVTRAAALSIRVGYALRYRGGAFARRMLSRRV